MLLSKNDFNYVKLICDSDISQFNQLKNENDRDSSADYRSKSKILKTTIPGQSSPVLGLIHPILERKVHLYWNWSLAQEPLIFPLKFHKLSIAEVWVKNDKLPTTTKKGRVFSPQNQPPFPAF